MFGAPHEPLLEPENCCSIGMKLRQLSPINSITSHQIFLVGAPFVARMQALIEKDTGNAKDIPRLQRRATAKPIEYYLKRNKDRDAGIREAVAEGQHSMTDIGKALELTVSRVSQIVKAGNESMARGKA